MISTTELVPAHDDGVGRLVELNDRLNRNAGQPDDRAEQLGQLGDVGVRHVERPHHLLVELGVLRRGVRKHQDRAIAQHLVRQLIDRQNLLQRLFERDAVELNRGGTVGDVPIVGDVDAGRAGDEIQDVAQAGVGEAKVERLARRRIENRLGRRGARPLPHLLDGRPRPRRLDPLANDLIERGDLGGRQAVRRIVLTGQTVLAAGGVELILSLELLRPIEMRARRRQHGALERDLVVRVVRRRLHRRPVVRDRLVEIAGAHRDVALPERPPGGAAADQQCRGQHDRKLLRPRRHSPSSLHITSHLSVCCVSSGVRQSAYEPSRIV